MLKILVGTSGWSYNHWKKVFYPENLSKYKWFEFYSKHFETVEINSTFYRKFKKSTFLNWYRKSPEKFQFSLKFPKTITHIKKLKNIENEVDEFIKNCENLKEKIGVFLIQLPPSLKFNISLLKDFFEFLLKYPHKFSLEIRNKTYHNDTFLELLKNYNIALCFSDTAGRYPSLILEETADFLYIRLHGSKKLYASNYEDKELISWSDKILSFKKDAYIYFDNDFNGYAPLNAIKMKKIIDERLQKFN